MCLTANGSKPLLLIFPFNLLSHYLRCLALARHFSPYFDVFFAHSASYADFIADGGFKTFECLSLDAVKVMEHVRKFDFSWLSEKDLEEVFNSQVQMIGQLKPLAVLGDTSPTLKMAAEKTGVHFISLMNGYMSRHYSFARKLSRTYPAYPFLKMFPTNILDLLTKKGEAFTMRQVHLPFKKIRKNHKLAEKKSYLDELEGDTNLLCDLHELFPQKDLPVNYKIIAPLYYNPAGLATTPQKKSDKNKQTIFVSMGSTGDWRKMIFLNDASFSKYNLVTAGDEKNILHASHITRERFVNFHEIFPHTDLVICHGGNGTIYQALSYGIPVLCKTSHFEQEWNVAALERLGIGKSLDGLESIAACISLVDQWINKKQDSQFNIYRQRIEEENNKVGNTIKKFAAILTAANKS